MAAARERKQMWVADVVLRRAASKLPVVLPTTSLPSNLDEIDIAQARADNFVNLDFLLSLGRDRELRGAFWRDLMRACEMLDSAERMVELRMRYSAALQRVGSDRAGDTVHSMSMPRADVIVWNLEGSRRLEMRNEAACVFEGAPPSIHYSREFRFQMEVRPSSCHGVVCSDNAGFNASVLLYAGGGASGVHHRSLCILGGQCFVAIGPYVVSLSLPTLEILWSTEVDSATCFGVHPTLDGRALISHGELEVSRVAPSGEILWTAGGADVFSEGMVVTKTEVQVEDFNHDRYVFDVETGERLTSGR